MTCRSTGEQGRALNRRLGRVSAAHQDEYLSEHTAHPLAAAVAVPFGLVRTRVTKNDPRLRDGYVFVLSDAGGRST